MSASIDSPARPAQEPLLLDVVLYPHRSLSPTGFTILMSGACIVAFIAGIVFVSIGAWPVFGFFGVEFLLLGWCFRLNYRHARLYETVQISRSELRVERVQPNGETRSWSFQPFWLRVAIDDPPEPSSRLTLTSHGKNLVIGSFLSPEERLDLAHTIRAALEKVKRPPEADGILPAG